MAIVLLNVRGAVSHADVKLSAFRGKIIVLSNRPTIAAHLKFAVVAQDRMFGSLSTISKLTYDDVLEPANVMEDAEK